MRILSLNGLLGYGYEQASLERAMNEFDDIEYMGVDAGSIDPGPFYLGSGLSFTNYSAVKRDLELALPYALKRKIPLIIGTAGGSGSIVHLNWCREILAAIAREKGLAFTMAVIETDVTGGYVKEKLRKGKVIDMGPGFSLTEENIDRCTHIVSQIGIEPFLKVLEGEPVDVILAGRACDTAVYAAPAIRSGFDEGLAIHMAKIMECGALCAEPMSAADVMIATLERDGFLLEPASLERRCTVARVAAHTMYEQGNPYFINEPNGTADLRECDYEQANDRAVRVRGSKFSRAVKPTLKLEGAMLAGYRTFTIAGISDPSTISRIDALVDSVRRFVAKNLSAVDPKDYTITLRKYGMPLPGAVVPETPQCDLGIIIDVVARTQDIANSICALSRARLLHTDYPGRKSSAGNLAFPYSPSDVIFGPVYTFGVYHLVEVDDLCETAKIGMGKVGV